MSWPCHVSPSLARGLRPQFSRRFFPKKSPSQGEISPESTHWRLISVSLVLAISIGVLSQVLGNASWQITLGASWRNGLFMELSMSESAP